MRLICSETAQLRELHETCVCFTSLYGKRCQYISVSSMFTLSTLCLQTYATRCWICTHRRRPMLRRSRSRRYLHVPWLHWPAVMTANHVSHLELHRLRNQCVNCCHVLIVL